MSGTPLALFDGICARWLATGDDVEWDPWPHRQVECFRYVLLHRITRELEFMAGRCGIFLTFEDWQGQRGDIWLGCDALMQSMERR